MAGPALNYYLGLKIGDAFNVGAVTAGTTTTGTAADFELRLQINDGSNPTGMTRKDAALALCKFANYIESGGNNHAGTFLPKL